MFFIYASAEVTSCDRANVTFSLVRWDMDVHAHAQGAISFWKEHVRPTLNTRSDGAARESGKLDLNAGDKRKEDLFSAYCGLLHV